MRRTSPASPALTVGVRTVGALAVGALAVGALAVGAFALVLVPALAARPATTVAAGAVGSDVTLIQATNPANQSPAVDRTAEPGSSTGAGTSRVGGSDPSPGAGKPGWVWWVAGAFVVMLGAGGFRLWRSTLSPSGADSDPPESSDQLDQAG